MQKEIQNLPTFTKPKRLKQISKFGSLILVEAEKDKKIFHIIEVSSKSLLKNIKKLSQLNLLSGLDTIFSSKGREYAKLNINEYLINLKSIEASKISLTESQISTIMKVVFEVKSLLINNGLIEMMISPDLSFIDKNGNFICVVLKVQREEDIIENGLNLFQDVFKIFLEISNLGDIKEISKLENLDEYIQEFLYSTTFKKFFIEFSQLYKSEIDFRAWKKINTHRLLKVRFKKKNLKSVYEEIQLKIENFGELYKKSSEPEIIIPDQINWRNKSNEDSKTQPIVLTSDSSGGSNSKESQLKEKRLKPCLGGQASQRIIYEEKSRIFVESCEEIIQEFIEIVKKETSSSFLVNSLMNLEETLKFCELKDPNKTILMLEGLLSKGEFGAEEVK